MDEYGEVSGNDSDSCFASSESWDPQYPRSEVI